MNNSLPIELENYICQLANNKCHTCQVICKIPYKKLAKFYFCSKVCYKFN